MVVKEDGSKWACQSCLKGHRVSGCNHTDRELVLVPKKGRPVTQCHHCRSERKKRSAHVSCDCAQPEKLHHTKEKCVHLREAEEKAKHAGTHDDATEMDSAHMARVAEEQGCCCGHGGKCSCALLVKELEDDLSAPRGPAVKPKLEKATSEGCITQFKNGHHKPVHRKNHAAHECGMPYRVPMPRHHTDQPIAAAARRSVENLALDTTQPIVPTTWASHAGAGTHTSHPTSGPERLSPSGAVLMTSRNEDLQSATSATQDFAMLPAGFVDEGMQSGSDFGQPSYDGTSGMCDDPFEPFPTQGSTTSANFPNNNPFGVWPTSADATTTQPALTAASSGTTSEIDEMPHVDEYMPSIQEDLTTFDFMNMPSSTSPGFNRRSLPPGFFGNSDFAFTSIPNEWQAPTESFDITGNSKPAMRPNRPTTSLDQSWQSSNGSAMTPTNQRLVAQGLPVGSRPQSRSFGPSAAPDVDILKQLFPDIVDGELNMFNNARMDNFDLLKVSSGMPNDDLTSLDFGPMGEDNVDLT